MRLTVGNLLTAAARRYGNKPVVVAPDRTLTFEELDQLSTRFALHLMTLGVHPGDRVTLWMENGWRWMVAYYAVLKLGAIVNPCNIVLTADEVEFIAADCAARAIIMARQRAGGFHVPSGTLVVTDIAGKEDAEELSIDALLSKSARDREELPTIWSDDTSTSTIGYTSGTTGRPKGAQLSHATIVTNTVMTALMHGRSSSDVVVSALPCTHVYGNIVMNAAVLCGMTLVLLPRFDEAEVLRAVAVHRATMFEGVPTMFMRMLNFAAFDLFNLSSLRLCTVGGQTMPVAKIEETERRFGCPLIELWGMTELGGLGTTHPHNGAKRHGSIGVALPLTEAKVAAIGSPTEELPRGEVGELLIRGPLVMQGYFRDEAATRATIEPDGWLHTGDLVRQDSEGYFYVVDRAKEVILSGGYNVYPAEVERVIAQHPGVAMVAVAAMRDELKGQVAKAFVIRKAGAQCTEQEIISHCGPHLAAYKIPRAVAFVEDFPKTSSGKILRRVLADSNSEARALRRVLMVDFSRDYTMTINGKRTEATSTFESFNPATRDVIAAVPDATRAQLDAAVAAAREALPRWSAKPLAERQKALLAIAQAVEDHAESFMQLLTREQGKPRAGAEWEIGGSVIWCREIAKQSLKDEVVEDTPSRRVVTRFTPIGVVGAITPWNFPVLLAIWKIAPALVTGNCMVLKPSPFTPLCTLKLGELCRDLLPPGVFNVVSGGDELGKWMTAHAGIDKIAFTGHTETGKSVMRSAATNLKRLTLELGGNDPAVVLPDVDPKEVAPKLFWAAFQNNAQFCNSTKRLYVHEKIYDKVLAELTAFAKTIKVGDGSQPDTQLGPIQNEPQYQKVLEYIEDCERQRHRFALGGKVDRKARGWFIPVTLVDNPPDDSRIVAEEPFGPILPVLKWKDEEEVIRRANDTRYGLGASVWGKDLEAVQRIGSKLQAGTVWLNEVHQYSPHQAFGGHKESGIGCENSLHGLMEYTNWQTITLNKAQ